MTMNLPQAFIALRNLLNRPCLRAFYSGVTEEVEAYYRVSDNAAVPPSYWSDISSCRFSRTFKANYFQRYTPIANTLESGYRRPIL